MITLTETHANSGFCFFVRSAYGIIIVKGREEHG